MALSSVRKYDWIILLGLVLSNYSNGNPVSEPPDHTEPCLDSKCTHHNANQKKDPQSSTPEVGGFYGVADAEEMLHGPGGGHIHDDQSLKFQAAPDERHADAPDIDALLHGGVSHVHSETNFHQAEKSAEEYPNMADDLDAMLHGGDAHAHSTGTAPEVGEGASAGVQFDTADLEAMLHGGDGQVHSHERNQPPTDREPSRQVGTADLEAMLHGDDGHAHSSDHAAEETENDGVPFGAANLDALLHGGDTHAHDRPEDAGSFLPDIRDSRPIGVADPEHLLHGDDGTHEEHVIRQAVAGSRPLGDKDPDDASDVKTFDVTIGTLRAEDMEDYKQWKSEKNRKDKGMKEADEGWLSAGFSYLSDAIQFDMQAVKQRYLAKLWNIGKEEEKKGTRKGAEKEDGTMNKQTTGNKDTAAIEDRKETHRQKLPHDES